jgi:predicted SAM-dependent methyltransferase
MKQKLKQLVKNIPPFGYLISQVRFLKGHCRLKRLGRTASPLRMVVGSGGVFDESWIPTDIEYLNLLDKRHWGKYFYENSIDAILAEHVWEHLTLDEGLVAAQHCYQYLKPGGYLRVAVPDGFHPSPEYIEWVKVGGVGPGSDDHKVLYNHETFSRLFEKAGFRAELLEYFDAEGNFHCADWNPAAGKIHRSARFDERNKDGGLRYTSLVLDVHKDG